MTSSRNDAEALFKRLDVQLYESIEEQYFLPPRDFKSLVEVLAVVGEKIDQKNFNSKEDDLASVLKNPNPAYRELLSQRLMVNDVIEDVVTFENGGLNNSVDAMTEVVKESERARDDVRTLRESTSEIRSVLTSKRRGQIPLKDLWFRKVELAESLRILKDLEMLRSTPSVVLRAIQQRRYLSSVISLDRALRILFSEDIVAVTGLSQIREQLLDLKESVLETIVLELKESVLGVSAAHTAGYVDGGNDDSSDEEEEEEEDDEEESDFRSAINPLTKSMSLSSMVGYGLGQTDSRDQDVVRDGWGAMALDEVDLALEDSLIDPAQAGGLFVRLLVRSVGLLRYEEDVERLLLESVGSEFKKGVRHIRHNSSNKLRKSLRRMDADSSEDQKLNFQIKIFTVFIEELLSSSLRLLKRLFYVLRLLSAHRKKRNGEKNYLIYTIKEGNKKAILAIWAEIEQLLVDQLQMHFLDRDVAEITDKVAGGREERDKGLEVSGGQKNPFSGAEDGDEDLSADRQPIFPPSARLAAPVYKLIVMFNNIVRAIMVEEGIEQVSSSSTANTSSRASTGHRHAASGPPGSTSAAGSHFEVKVGMSVMETIKAVSDEKVVTVSAVLLAVQIFLEEELLPVIQSSVNDEMRTTQSNIEHFALPSYRGTEAEENYGRRDVTGPVPATRLSWAVLSCMKTAKPLFTYWLRLPQHGDMVLTILDRLIRGFASAAKEELEQLVYKLLSADTKYKNNVLIAVRTDASFSQYRQSLYGGCSSVDEIVNTAIGQPIKNIEANKNIRPSTYSASVSTDSPGVIGEIEGWGALWVLKPDGGVSYPVDPSRLCNDFASITTIAAIAHGSDWLVGQLSRACAATAKKIQASTAFQERRSEEVHSSSSFFNKHAGGNELSRQEALALQVQLWESLRGGMKELSKLAEDGLAVLRGEVQIACFYHLQRLIVTDNLQDPESIVSALLQHLMSVLHAILYGTTGSAVASVLSPLCCIAPRVLLRCLRYLSLPSTSSSSSSSSGMNKNNNSNNNGNNGNNSSNNTIYNNHSSINNNKTTTQQPHPPQHTQKDSNQKEGKESKMTSEGKTKFLRAMVHCQQSLTGLFETKHIDPSTYRRMKDSLTEEFERIKKYSALLDMNLSDIKSYLSANPLEFSEEEARDLWTAAHIREEGEGKSNRLPDLRMENFENFWESCQSNAHTVVSSPTTSSSFILQNDSESDPYSPQVSFLGKKEQSILPRKEQKEQKEYEREKGNEKEKEKVREKEREKDNKIENNGFQLRDEREKEKKILKKENPFTINKEENRYRDPYEDDDDFATENHGNNHGNKNNGKKDISGNNGFGSYSSENTVSKSASYNSSSSDNLNSMSVTVHSSVSASNYKNSNNNDNYHGDNRHDDNDVTAAASTYRSNHGNSNNNNINKNNDHSKDKASAPHSNPFRKN